VRASDAGDEGVTWGEPAARWILLATVLGSGMAFLDATVVNVALPTIGVALNASVAGLQWILNGYTLALASLILIGGSLGDRFGRRRVFVIGVVWFAAASLLCGMAPTADALSAARALQGIGGALLTPGSLAILQASFAPGDRGRAVGAWSGLSGIAAAIGPFVGGWLVEIGSWRLIFLINLPLALAVVAVSVRHVPESRDRASVARVDWLGAALTTVALAGLTWALIQAGEHGATPARWRPAPPAWRRSPASSPWSGTGRTRCCPWTSSARGSSPPPTSSRSSCMPALARRSFFWSFTCSRSSATHRCRPGSRRSR
jgi:MFS family permease